MLSSLLPSKHTRLLKLQNSRVLKTGFVRERLHLLTLREPEPGAACSPQVLLSYLSAAAVCSVIRMLIG